MVWHGVWGAALEGAPITLIAPASHRHSFVSMRVRGRLCRGRGPTTRRRAGKRIPIGGPEALSWQDVTAKASAVLGQPLQVNLVQPGEPVPFLPPGVDQIMIAGERTRASSTFNNRARPSAYRRRRLLK